MRRTFAEHVPLLEAFSHRVAALSPEAWQRLREHCKPLAGNEPSVLVARAHLTSSGLASFSSIIATTPPPLDWLPLTIATLHEGFGTTLFTAIEVAFVVAPSLNEPSRPRRSDSTRPEFDRAIDAHDRIRTAAQANTRYDDGVECAIVAAARALQQRDWFTERKFAAIYRWIEPEIPAASLDAAVREAGTASPTPDAPATPPSDASVDGPTTNGEPHA